MLVKAMVLFCLAVHIASCSQESNHFLEISKSTHLHETEFIHDHSSLILKALMSENCNKVLWGDFDMKENYVPSLDGKLEIATELTHVRENKPLIELGDSLDALSCAVHVSYPESSQSSFQDPYVKMLCVTLAKLYGQNCELRRQLDKERTDNYELHDILNRFIPYKVGQVSALNHDLTRQLTEIRWRLGLSTESKNSTVCLDSAKEFSDIKKELAELRESVSLSLRGFQVVDTDDISE